MNEINISADNYVEKPEVSHQIKEIGNKIEEEKSKIKKLNDTKDLCIEITKSFKRILDLLVISVKGPSINRLYDEITSENAARLSKIDDEVTIQTQEIEKRIANYEREKYELQNPKKEESEKKEEKKPDTDEYRYSTSDFEELDIS